MTPAAASRWFVGPAADLLLGCGLLYALLFAALLATGDWFLSNSPAFLAPLLILVFSFPHYGATLLRVYEQRSERSRYALFSLWATLAILAWFIAGQHIPMLGAALLTLYVSWSPWHYTGQNFGIAVAFLRRRGVALDGATRRTLHASFASSFVLFFAAMHESTSWAASRQLPLSGEQVRFLSLGTPTSLTLLAALACLATTATAIALLLKRASLREATPALLLILSQALWFSAPAAVRHWNLHPGGPLDPERGAYFVFWVAVAHSVQYLWITRYYAKAGGNWQGSAGYFARTFLAGTALWLLPVAIFSPAALGGVGYEAGLALLVASAINVHHFVLDGAIWKLRDGPIARILIRAGATEPGAVTPERGRLRPAVWTLAGLSAAASIFVFATDAILVPRALERGDARAATRWLDALDWLGRDLSSARGRAAGLHYAGGETDAALAQFERSLALLPRTETYGAIVEVLMRAGRDAEALAWSERLLAFAPERPEAVGLAARNYLQAGREEEGRALLARARKLAQARSRDETLTARALVY